MIPFGAWLPDQPAIQAPHLRAAKNVVPLVKSYGPFRRLTNATTALASRPFGAGSFRDAQGATHVYAGLEDKLRELANDGTWSDRTRVSGGDYACAVTSAWRFAQFGDRCLATNFDDEVQYITMSSGATAFADLPGSPPRARHIASFRDFVVLGYTDTSAFEIAWSGFNDSEGWTAGTNQSDRQILADGGIVQGFAGSDVLYIFQQARIRRMQYVGPPVIMQIDPLTEALGCTAPGSIADFGGGAAFLSNDGFYILAGDQLIPIGADAVDEWFLADLNDDFLHRITAAANTKSKVIYWSYPSTQSVNGIPDTLLMYNWTAKKWAYARFSHEGISRVYSLGFTLDSLDALTTNIDNFDVPLDDPSLTGGSLQVNGWTTAWQLGPLSGQALEAEIETGDFELNSSKRTYVSAVEPYVDTTDVTVAVSARERLGDAAAYASAEPLETTGKASADASGRFHRFLVTVGDGASWNHAVGLDFEAALDGEA